MNTRTNQLPPSTRGWTAVKTQTPPRWDGLKSRLNCGREKMWNLWNLAGLTRLTTSTPVTSCWPAVSLCLHRRWFCCVTISTAGLEANSCSVAVPLIQNTGTTFLWSDCLKDGWLPHPIPSASLCCSYEHMSTCVTVSHGKFLDTGMTKMSRYHFLVPKWECMADKQLCLEQE